ncbi:MAG: peptidoglycan DD-metalloendopeptidase family protein [Stellaceae bacterium]
MARTFLVLLLAVLVGCARTAPPAPFELHGGAGAQGSLAPIPPHPDSIAVANGDTLYGIARRYRIPVRAIIDANRLQPPYRLAAGTRLALPQVRVYQVRSGDTLAGVARRYAVDIGTLAAANHLAPPYVIRTGTELVLPSPVETAGAALPTLTESPPPAPMAAAPAPPGGLPIRVETAPAASARLSIESAKPVPERMPLTQTASQNTMGAQQAPHPPSLSAAVAPGVGESAGLPSAFAAPQAANAVGRHDIPSTPVQNAKTVSVASSGGGTAVPSATPLSTAEHEVAALPHFPVPGHGFLWPVRGRIISSFGTGPDGLHNDGINIAAAAGTPMVAAEAGEVAYAGNELKGYGNLVLIKHPDGYVTAYAHNQTLLVKRGDHVQRGQPIARIGATGAVSEPQLHFEIRRGPRALDPIEYLPAEAATK